MTGADVQPRLFPLPTTSSSASRITPDTPAPAQSKVALRGLPCPITGPRSSRNHDNASTMHPAGTFTKNTDCQPR